MLYRVIVLLLFIISGFVWAGNTETILKNVSPVLYWSEMDVLGSSVSDTCKPSLNISGQDWYVGASPYVGGGVSQSESLRDTVSPRGYMGVYLSARKDSINLELNLLYDSFDKGGLKQYKKLQYTGFVEFRHDWFLLKAGHDVVHLGPGIYNNLTFNRLSNAYDMISASLDLGPLHVYSFYGSLKVKSDLEDESVSTYKNRDVYGHRYEIKTERFAFGISEATTLYDNNQPWLIVPTVPLFMEKGNFSENTNNGAISFDFEYLIGGTGRLYTEFLLDDMESPIRLVANDNVESKWGWMAGFQLEKDFIKGLRILSVGTVAEYARVEPFVYTHFISNTAQMAHAGRPLGNPNGPNSQAVDWSIYALYDKRLKLMLHNKWLWKGTDYGSLLNDETRNALHTTKTFLKGAKMHYSLVPYLCYMVNHISYQLGFRLFYEQEAYGNVTFGW